MVSYRINKGLQKSDGGSNIYNINKINNLFVNTECNWGG